MHRQPRRKVTTHRQNRYIVVSHLRDRFITAVSTACRTLGRNNRPVAPKTVRNRLRDAGIRACRPVKCPILKDRHKREPLAWARRHVRVTGADWASVLFVDETRVKLRGADGRTLVFRRRGERHAQNCVVEVDQFGGGSLMLWAGISMNKKTPIVTIQDNLTARKYQTDVVLPFVIPHIRANRRMALAQDNAPCHAARATQALLAANNVRLVHMPAKNPDLNPIEHVWDLMKRRVRALAQQLNLATLQRDINLVWANIDQRDISQYVASMRSR